METIQFKLQYHRDAERTEQVKQINPINFIQLRKGNATPSIEVLLAIATEFHVSVYWLLGVSKSEIKISSVADVVNFIFQMNDLNEIRYELEINDHLPNNLETEENKWYYAIKFFGILKVILVIRKSVRY